MGHLYHSYVSHNQRAKLQFFGSCWIILEYRYVLIIILYYIICTMIYIIVILPCWIILDHFGSLWYMIYVLYGMKLCENTIIWNYNIYDIYDILILLYLFAYGMKFCGLCRGLCLACLDGNFWTAGSVLHMATLLLQATIG